MGEKKTLQKCMVMMLSFVMVVGLAPISVMAEAGGLTLSESGEIISFEELAPEITTQIVPLGTSESELSLPGTLTAEVRLASAPEADEPHQEEQAQDSEEPRQEQETRAEEQEISTVTGSAVTINEGDESGPAEQQDVGGADASQPVTMSVPVTWTASPEYDGGTADKYIFTPELPEGFTLADDVSLPTITVTVEQAAAYGEITAFDALADELRWQNTASPSLPETVSGTVAGKAADIPVAWEADHEYNADSPAKGLYVFTAKAGSGYTVADGVETPRITVYIPALQRRLMPMAVGAGTSGNALEITTAAQLAEIATLVNAGRLETFLFNDSQATVYLTLGNDIDLSDYGEGWNGGKGWVPIGTESHHFKGMFDGGGNKITGLYINSSGLDYAGLFGYMDGSTVQNLGVADVNITGGSFVGGVAGCVYSGGMTYCYTTGTVAGTGNLTGGVVGLMSGNITNCYASCEVAGTGFVGGVAGSNGGDITNCYATGEVTGTGCVGGVSGFISDGRIQDCVALNLSVSGSNNVGRVAFNLDGTLSDNSAFSGMTVTENNAPKSIISDAAGLDGADMDAAVIRADGTLGGPFTAENGWTVENGKLPGINETAEMPDYIADVSDPNFRGEGTPESPYQISTAAQLAKLAELVNWNDTNYNSKYYKLTADINLSAYGKDYDGGQGWMPIGAGGAFSGTFDGGGHVISGLYSHRTDTSYGNGLFGSVEYGAIKNLGVTDADITRGKGGIVCSVSDGSVTNCYSTGTVTGSEAVGGIVGGIGGSSSVTNCYSACTVTGNRYVGGIVGSNSGGSVTNCYSTGTVTGNRYVGGISGTGGSVTNCAALNLSISGSDNFGRVEGQYFDLSSVNCSFSGMTVNGSTVSSGDAASINGADKDAAAITGVGFFQNLFGNDSAWIYADGKLPILAGFAEGAQDAAIPYYICGSYFGGGDGSSEAQAYEISTAAQLAKLAEVVNAGDPNYYGKYYRLTDDIDLSGYDASNTGFNAGKGWVPIGEKDHPFQGVFYGTGHTITGLSINNQSLYYAGLFGRVIEKSTIENLGVMSANVTGRCYTGGVAGYVSGGNIINCYSTGAVSGGSADVGGVAGHVSGGNIINCYSTGAVSGGSYVGGVAGYVTGDGNIINCYSTGAVSGSYYVGGVTGVDNGSVTGCAALNPGISGVDNVGRVTGQPYRYLSGNYAFSGMTGGGSDKTGSGSDGADITAAQMNSASFWTDADNWGASVWDTAIWTIQDGKLPILKNVGGIQSGDSGLYLTIRDIQYADIDTGASYTYNGSLITPVVKFDGVTLVKDKDYEIFITSTDGEGTSAGTQAGTVSLTISGKGNFSGTKSVTYTINKAPAPTLVWPVTASISFGDTLSDSALTGGSTAYGSFAWTDGDTVPTVENSGYSVTFTPNAATVTNYEAITETTKAVQITVDKAPAPTLVWPTAASVTYGAKLSDSALTGGSTAYGSFTWTDGDTLPTVENSGYSVTFTPSTATTVNYEAITETTKTVIITVNKAPVPTLSPQTVSIYRGTASTGNTIDLAALLPTDRGTTSYSVTSLNTLVQHVSVNTSGTLSFDILSSDSVTMEDVTVEAEMQNYEDAVFTTTVNFVNKKVSVVMPSVSGSLSYGQPLSTLTIDATALADNGSTPVSGSIAWNEASIKPAVDAPAQSWTFTPSDTAVYEIVTGMADITVNKAVPQGTPAITQISVTGKDLSDAILTGSFTNPYDGSPAPGTLRWDLPDTTAVTRGTIYSWTFMPEDTSDYSVRTGSLTPYPGGTGGGSSSGGSSDSDSPATSTTTAPEKRPDQPVTVSVSVTAAGTKGTAGTVIPDKVITDAIAKAQYEAKAQGKTANGISVALNITAPKGISAISATLSQNALKALVDAGVSSLEMNGLPVSVSFDRKALQAIRSQSNGDVTVTAVSGQDLSSGAKAMIGTRPVYNITVGYTANGSVSTLTNLSGGTATVSIPYTPTNNECVGCLYAVYVDGKGNATRIDGSAYDANSGCLIFTTDHFSIYGVGYMAPSTKFTDTSKHWAGNSIDYVVGRGLLAGTSGATFSPDTAMTRGMLVTVLGRLAGADVSGYQISSFTDVKTGSYYLPYIEWAHKIGIIQGIGNNQFAPDRAVTREELALIFANYAKATGYTLPVTRVSITFADSGSIGSIYKIAVTAMQQAGIMLGENNNKFSPKASATRAEVAAMLTRYIKLTIDPTTAQSWEKNDSGQWMYFKDGKALTGWQTINGKIYCFDSSGSAYANGWRQNSKGEWFYLTTDGSAARGWKDIGGHRYYFCADAVMVARAWLEIDGKWYYFYADGSLARSTTIDGYKVDENGVRKVE